MKFVGNRVLLVLVLGGLLAGLGLPFVTSAPNRLVTGTGIRLDSLLVGWRASLLLPAAALALGAFLPQTRRTHATLAIAATLLLAGLVWLAGAHARQLAETVAAISRTSFGGGFWLLVFFLGLPAALPAGSRRTRSRHSSACGRSACAPPCSAR